MSHPTVPAELATPPTANPCPTWCGLRAGHGYESTTLDRQRLTRYHAGHEMRLPLGAGGSAGVEITSEESADRAERDVKVSPAAVELWGNDGARLTVHEALSLSDMLARAALRLREIGGER